MKESLNGELKDNRIIIQDRECLYIEMTEKKHVSCDLTSTVKDKGGTRGLVPGTKEMVK